MSESLDPEKDISDETVVGKYGAAADISNRKFLVMLIFYVLMYSMYRSYCNILYKFETGVRIKLFNHVYAIYIS